MKNLQRETLLSHLRTMEKVPPQHQLEEVQQMMKVHHGLYKQEGDAEGMAIYEPLLKLALNAKTMDEFLHNAKQQGYL